MPIYGKYNNKEDAVKYGTETLYEINTKIIKGETKGLGNCIIKPAEDYINWYKLRGSKQLTLF